MLPEKTEIALADVLDFAYCPLRVWWRKSALAPDAEGLAGARPQAGEQLLRQAVQQALFVYQRYHAARQLSLPAALGLVWKIWLDRWGLSDLAPALVEYSQRRAGLLARFAPGGDLGRADGQPYQRPTWTRAWRMQADASGLRALQQRIDARQAAAGLATLALPAAEAVRGPLGLAEVFAIASAMIDKWSLPTGESLWGVSVPLVVELLSLRLHLTADLVLDGGTQTLRGRPPAGAGPRTRPRRIYELHLYEEDPPLPYRLARDMRVLALGQAQPLEQDGPPAQVTVQVRHLHSGAVQPLAPADGSGRDVLEALATTAAQGIRAGAYLPRMVSGWQACGDCDYRGLCFTDPGVALAYNPPRMAQIADSQALWATLKALCARSRGARDTLETFLTFLLEHPGCAPAAAWQMLQSIAEEG